MRQLKKKDIVCCCSAPRTVAIPAPHLMSPTVQSYVRALRGAVLSCSRGAVLQGSSRAGECVQGVMPVGWCRRAWSEAGMAGVRLAMSFRGSVSICRTAPSMARVQAERSTTHLPVAREMPRASALAHGSGSDGGGRNKGAPRAEAVLAYLGAAANVAVASVEREGERQASYYNIMVRAPSTAAGRVTRCLYQARVAAVGARCACPVFAARMGVELRVQATAMHTRRSGTAQLAPQVRNTGYTPAAAIARQCAAVIVPWSFSPMNRRWRIENARRVSAKAREGNRPSTDVRARARAFSFVASGARRENRSGQHTSDGHVHEVFRCRLNPPVQV